MIRRNFGGRDLRETRGKLRTLTSQRKNKNFYIILILVSSPREGLSIDTKLIVNGERNKKLYSSIKKLRYIYLIKGYS